jgi:hypothetical protein
MNYFWNVVSCSSCVNRRFGRKYRLRLQDIKIRELGTSVSKWLQTDQLSLQPPAHAGFSILKT